MCGLAGRFLFLAMMDARGNVGPEFGYRIA
jgi:hypothetical protein